MNLTQKHCKPCEGEVAPLNRKQAEEYLKQLSGWNLDENAKAIRKIYKFRDFKEVIVFFNSIAALAEKENHHPDLKIGYSRVEVEFSTHAVKGLSENDFILASQFDTVVK